MIPAGAGEKAINPVCLHLKYESQVRPPLVAGDKDYHQITEDIVRPIENRPSKLWWIGFLICGIAACVSGFSP